MADPAQDWTARLAEAEDALWRARRRAETAEAEAARLQAERAGLDRARELLAAERQAAMDEAGRLRDRVADLSVRLEAAESAAEQLRGRLLTRFARFETLQRQRRGLTRMLGRLVLGLLGCRPEDRPGRRRLRRAARELAALGLVDPDFYRRTYPDVAAAGQDPVEHYLRHGAREDRDPRDPAGEGGA